MLHGRGSLSVMNSNTENASYPDEPILTTSRKVLFIRAETNTQNPIASLRACFARLEHAVCMFYQLTTHTQSNVVSCSPDLFCCLCLIDVCHPIAPGCNILSIRRKANTEHLAKNPQHRHWLKCVEVASPRMCECMKQFYVQNS